MAEWLSRQPRDLKKWEARSNSGKIAGGLRARRGSSPFPGANNVYRKSNRLHMISIVVRRDLMSESITLRLPPQTAKKLKEIAKKEGKDRSTLIRELLENGVKEKNLEHIVELYQTGQVTAWKAAQLAGISLWSFYKILEKKGVLIRYSQQDLDHDLKP